MGIQYVSPTYFITWHVHASAWLFNVQNSLLIFIVCVQRVSSGVGLHSVVLSDLHPDEDYSVQVRCGAQQNFWKWGNWSKPLSFKTSTYGKVFWFLSLSESICKFRTESIDFCFNVNSYIITAAKVSFLCRYIFFCLLSVPDAPDVWMWRNGDNTGQVIWKVILFFFQSSWSLTPPFLFSLA